MSTPYVALATAAELPELDEEGRLLLTALQRAGARAEPAVWDTDLDWGMYDVVVVRSTWDYTGRRGEFLAWAERVAAVSRLEKPPAMLRWSTDKRYLAELADAGVPVVPSAFLAPGDDPGHGLLEVEHVAKPTVSAGSKDTLRLAADEADRSRAHVAGLLDAGRDVLVQPYLGLVDERGETAIVLVEGQFSHAIRKGPLLQAGGALVAGLFAPEQIMARQPSDDELRVAAQALAAVPGRTPPLYARVDLLPTPQGPVVLELELAEPSLFLDHAEGAAERFAAAVLARS